MATQQIAGDPIAQNLPSPSNSSSDKQVTPITKLMNDAFFYKEVGGVSIHDRIIKAPFIMQLHSSTISAEVLLLNLVQEAKFYKKIEFYIKTHYILQKILAPDLFRAPCLKKDIKFLITNLNLTKPEIIPEAERFLKFIDETATKNPRLLLGIIYVLYSRIFEGRINCTDTIKWLKTRIDEWEQLPQDNNGVSFWRFRQISCLQNASDIKKEFIDGVHAYEKLAPEVLQKTPEIARQALAHMVESMEAVTEPQIPAIKNVKNITFTDKPLPASVKVTRQFMLVMVLAVCIRIATYPNS